MIWRQNDGALWTGAEPVSRSATLLGALAILGVFYFSFSHNEHCLMLGLDGSWYRAMFGYETGDRTPFTQTGVDALSGSFDAWYPLRPEYLLPHAAALPFASAAPSKSFIYVILSAFLTLSMYVVAHTVGAGRAVALAAGLLMPILAAAGFIDHIAQLYPLFEANPYWFQSTGFACLIVAAFWALNGERRLRTAILLAAPAVLFVLAVVSLAPHVLFMLPAVGLYAAGSLATAQRLRDNIPRVMAGLLMLAVPAALGIFTYYYSIIGYTAYQFFPEEIQHPLGGWMALSTMFWTSPFGAWVIWLGIAGALWTSVAAVGRLRVFALTHLVATTLHFAVGYWFAFVAVTYRGSFPVYFETGFWPYALMFSVVAIAAALRLVLTGVGAALGLPRRWQLRSDAVWWKGTAAAARAASAIEWLGRRSACLTLLGIVLAVASYNFYIYATPRRDGCVGGGFYPSRATAIIDMLQQNIALGAGMPFRGSVATIDAVKPGRPGDWIEFHAHDRNLWQETGNDHRTVGLWTFNIPTLFQIHTFMTPPYYLLLTDFLARPEDLHRRSSLVMTKLDGPIMRLWGVRYLITDFDSGAGNTLLELPTKDLGTLRLTELPEANLGDYSPTEPRQAEDFRSGLQIMHEPGFDGRRQVVTDAALEGPLVGATGARLVYERDGLHLTAQSTGRSVLVLPVQYSHCWTVAGPGQPSLFRADLMQLGVRFAGTLDARLVFRLGPIWASGCRVEDLRDMSRLRVEQARSPAWRAVGQP